MTTLGGVGHTLPYLIGDFRTATALAIAVVLIELWAIAWIRARYMDTKFLRAAFEVVVGGLIVFAAGDPDRQCLSGESCLRCGIELKLTLATREAASCYGSHFLPHCRQPAFERATPQARKALSKRPPRGQGS